MFEINWLEGPSRIEHSKAWTGSKDSAVKEAQSLEAMGMESVEVITWGGEIIYPPCDFGKDCCFYQP